MFASSESKSANKSEFAIINFYTWKNGLLLAGLPLCTVMSILGSRFLDSSYRHAVTAALIVVIVALVFLYVKESRRTSTLIVADDKLQHEAEVNLNAAGFYPRKVSSCQPAIWFAGSYA